MTKPCTGAAKVVRSHLLDSSLLGSLAHDPPDHLLADTRAPHGAAVGDTAEDQPVLNASNRHPIIYGSFYPVWHRHRAHMNPVSRELDVSVERPTVRIADNSPKWEVTHCKSVTLARLPGPICGSAVST